MRALIQRVTGCSVSIDGQIYSTIEAGMLVLLGVKTDDTSEAAAYLADRCAALRIFDDADGKMNRSIQDAGGSVMVVSQFTLYGDTRKGNRPSYTDAAAPELAEALYEEFIARMRAVLGPNRIKSGKFRAMMQVELVNDGPVTVMVESK